MTIGKEMDEGGEDVGGGKGVKDKERVKGG